MPALLLKLLLDPRVLVGIGFFLVLTFAGVQSERLKHAKADLVASRALARTAQAAAAASEKLRAAEYTSAKAAVSDAQSACAARVDTAHHQATAIAELIERPVHVDPKTSCPVRGLVGAVELRHALASAG